MEQGYATRLRYLDAADVDDSYVDFDGLDVRGSDDRKLGDIDGFIVDPGNGRVHYAVVDSGGWFTSRRFLMPIGHATIDRDGGVLRVEPTRESFRSYPEFDESQFRSFGDDGLREFEQRVGAVCWPGEQLGSAAVGSAYYESSPHYAQPEWWRERTWLRERLSPIDAGSYRTRTSAAAPSTSTPRSEPLRGADERAAERSSREERELVTAREAGESSPHYEGRAQPGDVLGLETGGETTGIGETAEDENKRRESADKALRDRR